MKVVDGKVELNVVNDKNIFCPIDIYLEYLKRLLEIEAKKENFEECAKIKEVIEEIWD